jgi:hypothetical protein
MKFFEATSLMLPLIWGSIPDLGPSFQQFANGLKTQAEAKATVNSFVQGG